MTYVIFAALALFLGFIGVLAVEARRGTRFFEAYRLKLDRLVGQGMFIIDHVDLAGLVREECIRLARRATHDLARFGLTSIRSIERFLTQLVQRLRAAESQLARPAQESTRSFVRTLSEFKGQLEATRPIRERASRVL